MTLLLVVSMLVTQVPIPRLDGGLVTGVVRFADGRPATNVRVAAMVVPEAGGEPSALAVISQTDSAGRYRLEAVPPGRYYIVAGRIDSPSYYPAGTDISTARVIAVTAGATIDTIDLTVSEVSTRPAPAQRFRTPPNLPNLPTLQNLLPTPQPSVQVKGRIVMDDTSKQANLPGRVGVTARYSALTPIVGQGFNFTVGSRNTNTQAAVAPDGSFSLTLPQGEADIIIAGLPEGYSIKSITAGGTDLQSHRLTVRAGGPEVVLVLTADLRPRFRIMGQIPEGAGGLLLGEQIELVSESGTTTRLLIDVNGHFLFGRLLPGKYAVRLASSKFKPAEQSITITDRDVTVEVRAEPQ